MSLVTLKIPISGNPFATFDIVLNGTNYTMKFFYNFRFNYWSFTLKKDTTVLLDNVKLVQGFNIGSEYHSLDLGGIFFIQSVSNDPSDPTLLDLGNDKNLFYQYESS